MSSTALCRQLGAPSSVSTAQHTYTTQHAALRHFAPCAHRLAAQFSVPKPQSCSNAQPATTASSLESEVVVHIDWEDSSAAEAPVVAERTQCSRSPRRCPTPQRCAALGLVLTCEKCMSAPISPEVEPFWEFAASPATAQARLLDSTTYRMFCGATPKPSNLKSLRGWRDNVQRAVGPVVALSRREFLAQAAATAAVAAVGSSSLSAAMAAPAAAADDIAPAAAKARTSTMPAPASTPEQVVATAPAMVGGDDDDVVLISMDDAAAAVAASPAVAAVAAFSAAAARYDAQAAAAHQRAVAEADSATVIAAALSNLSSSSSSSSSSGAGSSNAKAASAATASIGTTADSGSPVSLTPAAVPTVSPASSSFAYGSGAACSAGGFTGYSRHSAAAALTAAPRRRRGSRGAGRDLSAAGRHDLISTATAVGAAAAEAGVAPGVGAAAAVVGCADVADL